MEFVEFVGGDNGWVAVVIALGIFCVLVRILKDPAE